jgi:hypothetical protein
MIRKCDFASIFVFIAGLVDIGRSEAISRQPAR